MDPLTEMLSQALGGAPRKAPRWQVILLEVHYPALGKREADSFFFAQIPISQPPQPQNNQLQGPF